MQANVKIKNILYTTDLSDNARYAFSYALSLANLYGANLILLHVLPETPGLVDKSVVGYIGEEQWEAIKQNHFQDAKEALIGKRRDHTVVNEIIDQFRKDAKAGLGSHSIPSDEVMVKKGNPVEVILETADENNCDLIVMGTHGQGSLADAMMGSTARRVVRRSKQPVLVVRLPDTDLS
jgi:nucleotide-binding universal stress UspA family protein